MKRMLVDRLREAAEQHGWTVEVGGEDDDGNICMFFGRGRERVNVTVFMDRIVAEQPSGRLVYARDEHGVLVGRRALDARLGSDRCRWCP